MQESRHTRKVREFMYQANQNLPKEPITPDAETRILRAKLIMEECLETINALGLVVDLVTDEYTHIVTEDNIRFIDCGSYNPVEVIDGCCDIKVVTTGTMLACGFNNPDKWQDIIDDSNLDKFQNYCRACGSYDYTMTHAEHVAKCDNCGATYKFGHHREDGKFVKPSNWLAPSIKELLENG